MSPEKSKGVDKFERLRREAIELLERKPDFVTASGTTLKELLHELNVHQTELIIQNEELRASQKELAKITREYEALYEWAPCGYLTLTSQGIISRINQTALGLLEDQRIQPGVSRFSQFVEPGWDDLYYAALENARRTGVKQSLDIKIKTPLDIVLWIRAEIEAERNKDHEVRQWKLVFYDISHKILAETALQESEERFRTLFHNAPVAYQSLDEKGRLTEVNDSWLITLGYQRDEVIDKPFAQFLNPEVQTVFEENFSRFKAVGEILGVQFEMIKKDGSPVTVSFHGKIAKNTQGEFRQTHCMFSDITAQKKAERTAKQLELKLQQNNKLEAIGVLAGGIAHDFNNTLQPIIGFSELTLNELPANSHLRDNIEEILKGSQRAAELVRQILDFSSQKQKVLESSMVQGVLKEAIKFLRASIPSNVEFYQEISPDPIYILNDPIHLHEIAINLCTNAYHAMEEDGGLLSFVVREVDIKMESGLSVEKKAGRYCNLSISDSGRGIPPEYIDKIFDPYFTTKPVGKGSGMGLAVVYGIVKDLHGYIEVKSRPGKTQFDIYFPIVDPPEETTQIKEKKHHSIGNERILFVDDEKAIVKLVKKNLDELGYKTLGVTSSIDALEIFKHSPDKFDILITDVLMPDMIGTTLVKKVREIRPDIPVMVCTGGGGIIHLDHLFSLGINGVLSKPISLDVLSVNVRELLDQSQ